MAQPSHQFPTRVYTPAQSPYANPSGAYFPPPTKRVKLSPSPQSPQSSPTNQHIALPNQVFSSPYAPNAQNPTFSMREFEPPPPPITGSSTLGTSYQAGAMGPPSRPPVDKPTDMADLSDVLAGSGIDLKAEEAALVNRLSYEQQFGSGVAPTPNVYVPSLNGSAINQYYGNRVQGDILSRNIPGDRDSFYGAGTFNQPAVPYREDNDAAEELRKRAIRIQAEREQHHLNHPFLLPANVSKRVFKQAAAAHVKVNHEGLLSNRNQTPGPPIQAFTAGPDQNEVLTVLKGQDCLAHSSSLTHVLTLVSLACKERLRLIIEDTATIAHGRRTGAHGIVPEELADIAIGNGPSKPVTLAPDSTAVTGLSKVSLSNGLADPSTSKPAVTDALIQTIQFSDLLKPFLQESAKKKQADEERRLAKRQKRNNIEASPAEASRANSLSAPGLLGDRAPEVDTKKLSSKKELKRQENAKATEAQQHAATQQTMKMQLGGRSAQRSWMTSAKPAGGTGFPVQSRKPLPAGQTRASSGTGTAGAQTGKRKAQDDFREDGEMGQGIQMRDILLTLESDVKEGKALARAYRKLDTRGGPKPDTNMNGS